MGNKKVFSLQEALNIVPMTSSKRFAILKSLGKDKEKRSLPNWKDKFKKLLDN